MLGIRHQARAARRLGDLSGAARHYERLLELAPFDPEARSGVRILGEALGRAPDEQIGSGPLVPFAWFSRLLGDEDHRRIDDYLYAHLADLAPATIFRDGVRKRDSEARSARVLVDPGDVPDWFLERVREQLPRALVHMGEPAFSPERTEIHLSLSLDGDFYAPHTDDTTGYAFRLPRIDSRRISFVYYLFRSPPRFTGGELRLYDRCDAPDRFDTELYTSVVPQDDMLVFFPSDRFHGVAPVRLQSDDPRDRASRRPCRFDCKRGRNRRTRRATVRWLPDAWSSLWPQAPTVYCSGRDRHTSCIRPTSCVVRGPVGHVRDPRGDRCRGMTMTRWSSAERWC